MDPHLPRILDQLDARGALVLSAEPGTGKTTRLPPALVERLGGERRVVVLEPRRLAVRLAATRVASERGEVLGERTGYQVRYERRAGPRTRLLYVTEGVLTRRLAGHDGALDDVGAVVLDEFHERHVETDLALTLLERLRRERRPDLKLVVMSATLDPGPLAAYLGAGVVEVGAPMYPVEVVHAAHRDEAPLEDRVRAAVSDALDAGLKGHALVFLPGQGEIERALRDLEGLARREDLLLFALHGRLEPEAMDAALRPSARRKVILCTNVAESSVTIEGVELVIDAGLARVPGTSPATGLPTLELQPISQASAKQRAGRAGRQGPGRCVRLYTRQDHDRRPRAPIPELVRVDLSPAVLALRGAGVRDLTTLRWLDPPPPATFEAADRLLRRLGATADDGALTPIGRDLLRWPLPPRLGRVLAEGAARGVGALAATAVAILSERDVREDARGGGGGWRGRRGGPPQDGLHAEGPSDVLARMDLLAEADASGMRPALMRTLGLVPQAVDAVMRARRQLLQLVGERGRGQDALAADTDEREAALLRCLLAGHPDRVARRLRESAFAMAEGGQVELGPESVVRASEWLVVLDAADPRRGATVPRATLASAIDKEWLLELFPDQLVEDRGARWDAPRSRVESTWRLLWGSLVVDESPDAGDPAQVEALLRKEALAAGASAFADLSSLEGLRRRLDFARAFDATLPSLDDAAIAAALSALCEGRRSFAELRQADLLATLRDGLGHDVTSKLQRLAPTHVTLQGGRRLEVHYEVKREPWVESKLQDFFGMKDGPTVGGGRVKLVLHFLSPGGQDVSVTSDLAGFWERHYPSIRRELGRRYPRHPWPEDPLTATPPKPGRVR